MGVQRVFPLLWTPIFVYLTYSKGNIQYAIQDAIADNRILYLDKKRSQARLAVRKGANYPTAARKADFANNIRSFFEKCQAKRSFPTAQKAHHGSSAKSGALGQGSLFNQIFGIP